MSDETQFAINFADGTRFDLDAIRARRQSFMPDGEHAWVISIVYGIDDPEQAMDDMVLGAEEFIGVTEISCLLCQVPYKAEIRHGKCPQTLPER